MLSSTVVVAVVTGIELMLSINGSLAHFVSSSSAACRHRAHHSKPPRFLDGNKTRCKLLRLLVHLLRRDKNTASLLRDVTGPSFSAMAFISISATLLHHGALVRPCSSRPLRPPISFVVGSYLTAAGIVLLRICHFGICSNVLAN
ncbi:hypothetical protein Bca4012_037360 [Brassica carinata]